MSKVYKGYELIKAIADGEIKEKEIKLRFGSGYYTFYVDEDKIINNTNGTGLYICKCLNEEFEILNCEDEVDIDNIEELEWKESDKEYLGYGVLVANDKINELVQAVKQLNKEIKELKSLDIEISEKDINEAIKNAREQLNKEKV